MSILDDCKAAKKLGATVYRLGKTEISIGEHGLLIMSADNADMVCNLSYTDISIVRAYETTRYGATGKNRLDYAGIKLYVGDNSAMIMVGRLYK